MPDPIKVLIVEDSPTVAQILMRMMETDSQLQVVGVATDGTDAIRQVARYHPNVITMDVNMPHMSGLEATEYIMAHYPTPILVLTASLGGSDVDLSFKMLSAGALEIIEKPSLDAWQRESSHLLERVKLLSRIKVITHIRGKARYVSKFGSDAANHVTETAIPKPVSPALRPHPRPVDRSNAVTAPLDPTKVMRPTAAGLFITESESLALRSRKFRLVGIAASTGGPPALSKLLKQIPANFPVPIILVQHIPAGFSKGLADWLDGETELTVKIAEENELPLPGYAYLPADDRHLEIKPDLRLHLSDTSARYGLRPSADITFESMAHALSNKAFTIILTGMGRDGSIGMKAVREMGGYNIAQDEATSVIFGMPKSAIELGVVDKVLPLLEIPQILKQVFLA